MSASIPSGAEETCGLPLGHPLAGPAGLCQTSSRAPAGRRRNGAPSLRGKCLCGEVAFAGDAPPVVTVACHCTHCQKTSGSAFSVNAIVPGAGFRLTGDYSVFADRGESGGSVERCFCPKCGSPLASRLGNGMVAVKVGALESDEDVTPALQVGTRSARPWSKSLLAAPGFETNPPSA